MNFANKAACHKCGAEAPPWKKGRAAAKKAQAAGGEASRARVQAENAKLKEEIKELRKQQRKEEPATPAQERGHRIVQLRV